MLHAKAMIERKRQKERYGHRNKDRKRENKILNLIVTYLMVQYPAKA